MPTIAITGGIGSGKSTFTRMFAGLLQAETFDTDVCARQLLAEDAAVAAEVRAAFGEGVFDATGRPERGALRAIVFAEDPAPRRVLESILHPRVRTAWRTWLERRLQNTPDAPLLVEVPLLYETGGEAFFDLAIVVGCSLATQLSRLTRERHLPEATAHRIIASQWELSEKIRRCDHLVWNDGPENCLRAQAERCALYFDERQKTKGNGHKERQEV